MIATTDTEMTETERRTGGPSQGFAPLGARLDSEWLELMVESYPEEIREPVLWLGAYLRDDCGRSQDVLAGRAQKLGIEIDKTNWSKILRGRWNTDAENNP